MQDLGEMEDGIFKDRQNRELEFRRRNKQKKRREQEFQNRAPKWQPQGVCAPQAVGSGVAMSGKIATCLIIMKLMICEYQT